MLLFFFLADLELWIEVHRLTIENFFSLWLLFLRDCSNGAFYGQIVHVKEFSFLLLLLHLDSRNLSHWLFWLLVVLVQSTPSINLDKSTGVIYAFNVDILSLLQSLNDSTARCLRWYIDIWFRLLGKCLMEREVLVDWSLITDAVLVLLLMHDGCLIFDFNSLECIYILRVILWLKTILHAVLRLCSSHIILKLFRLLGGAVVAVDLAIGKHVGGIDGWAIVGIYSLFSRSTTWQVLCSRLGILLDKVSQVLVRVLNLTVYFELTNATLL